MSALRRMRSVLPSQPAWHSSHETFLEKRPGGLKIDVANFTVRMLLDPPFHTRIYSNTDGRETTF
jgi:hypothetical protein